MGLRGHLEPFHDGGFRCRELEFGFADPFESHQRLVVGQLFHRFQDFREAILVLSLLHHVRGQYRAILRRQAWDRVVVFTERVWCGGGGGSSHDQHECPTQTSPSLLHASSLPYAPSALSLWHYLFSRSNSLMTCSVRSIPSRL